MKNTIPGIFLIESTYREDEQHDLRERYALEEILRLAGGRLQHHYIRTRKELKHFTTEFRESRFRYLHLACHGDRHGIGLTYDNIRSSLRSFHPQWTADDFSYPRVTAQDPRLHARSFEKARATR